ncbi:hypothetical protein ACQY0O_001843 [Thecaphora frezii]
MRCWSNEGWWTCDRAATPPLYRCIEGVKHQNGKKDRVCYQGIDGMTDDATALANNLQGRREELVALIAILTLLNEFGASADCAKGCPQPTTHPVRTCRLFAVAHKDGDKVPEATRYTRRHNQHGS